MKRWIQESTATALGGLAMAAGLAAIIIAAMGGRLIPEGAVWAIPLVAGGTVGLLSWFLLAGASDEGTPDAGPVKTRCASCGVEVLEDWRLCPYCGGSSRPASTETGPGRVSF